MKNVDNPPILAILLSKQQIRVKFKESPPNIGAIGLHLPPKINTLPSGYF